jgi:molybdate transport system substrate-binding protein
MVSSMATRRLLAELIARIEEVSPTKIALESVGGVDAAKRVRQGEAFDLVVLASDAIDGLIADGAIIDGSRVDIVTSAVAIAVRAGSPHPDISSADAVRRAVLAAGSVGYSTGPSGNHLAKLFAGWGIADALAGRVVIAPPGVPVGTLVARGDLELGFQQLSELMALEGIEVAGLLPAEIQTTTTFSGGIAVTSKERDAARQVLAFMSDPAVAEIKRRHGMEPA